MAREEPWNITRHEESDEADPRLEIGDLFESRLFPSRLSFGKYTAKQVADITFLTCLSLQILKSEFEWYDFSVKYARKTLEIPNFDQFRFSSTDLSALVYLLKKETGFKKNPSNELFLKRIGINTRALVRWLRTIRDNRPNEQIDRQFLLSLEEDLAISTAAYKSMRRLIYHWGDDITLDEKKLVMTRLIFALRAQAPRSELLKQLETLAKRQRLIMSGACNPETGDCEGNRPSLLGRAVRSAIGAGVGYYLGRKLTQK